MDRDALALANVRPAVPVRSSVFEAIFEVCDATEATRKIALVFERANDPEVVARRRAALVEDVALDAAFRIFVEENPGVFVGRGDKTRKKVRKRKELWIASWRVSGRGRGRKRGRLTWSRRCRSGTSTRPKSHQRTRVNFMAQSSCPRSGMVMERKALSITWNSDSVRTFKTFGEDCSKVPAQKKRRPPCVACLSAQRVPFGRWVRRNQRRSFFLRMRRTIQSASTRTRIDEEVRNM